MATAKGHMYQTIKNLNLSKKQDPNIQGELLMTTLEQHTNAVFNKIIDPKRQPETDLTGKSSIASNRGNK